MNAVQETIKELEAKRAARSGDATPCSCLRTALYCMNAR
jgi:hypothetical protein